MNQDKYKPIIQSVQFGPVSFDVLRLDLIHPLYGGNKYFKLKYNIKKAIEQGYSTLITFGGAHSNHLYSTAAICKEKGIRAIAVIRGEDAAQLKTPTLTYAEHNGVHLHFIDRQLYKRKTEQSVLRDLEIQFGRFYLIPEGGANYEGVKGCTEILTSEMNDYDYVMCACGTAGTYSGLNISAEHHQIVVGISVLKGDNLLIEAANEWLNKFNKPSISSLTEGPVNRPTIINDYHLGGYATFSKELVAFKIEFEKACNFPLDHVYTSKLFFAVVDLIKNGRIPANKKILMVHTGGLQGNKAFEERYQLNPIL